MDELIRRLEADGTLSPESARRIEELESRAHVPLARELNALLYLGSALIVAGTGAAVKDRLDQIGPTAILAALGLATALCFALNARRAPPFTAGKAPAEAASHDYLLYLGCGLLGVFCSYLEWKWKPLGDWWDLYLFGSGLLFVALSYRYDNEAVLVTGLLNLAAALGFRAKGWDWGLSASAPILTVYGAALVGAGAAARRSTLKPHFAGSYSRLGRHLALMTLLVDGTRVANPQFWILMAACAWLGWTSLRDKDFETFASALAYAYLAGIVAFFRETRGLDFTASLWVILISAGAVIAVLLWGRASLKESA